MPNMSEEYKKKQLQDLLSENPNPSGIPLPNGGLEGSDLNAAGIISSPSAQATTGYNPFAQGQVAPAPQPNEEDNNDEAKPSLAKLIPPSPSSPTAPSPKPSPLLDKLINAPKPESNVSDAITKLLGGQSKELEDANSKRNINQLIANLGRAGNVAGAGLAGVRPETEFYDKLLKQAEQPVEDIQNKQKLKQETIKSELGKQQLTNEMGKEDPKSEISKIGRQIAQSASQQAGLNLKLPESISMSNLEKLMPGIEAMANKRLQAQALSTGKEEKAKTAADVRVQKAGEVMGKDIDPTGFRAGTMRDNQKRLDAAGRVEALYNAANGNPNSIQMRELATTVGGMLSNGSSTAVSQINELVPHSLRGDASKIQQWLLNEPTGLEQQKFAQMYLDIAHRERDVAQNQIIGAQVKKANQTHKWLKDNHPEDYYSRLSTATGIGDIDELKNKENEILKGKSSTKKLSDEDEQAVKWAKAHSDDPRAAQILKMHGM